MTLAEARQELAALIGAVDHLPERIDPPVITITAGDPYLEPHDYCSELVRLEATAIVRGSNEKATTDLDNLINEILDKSGDWSYERVDQPFQLEYNTAVYLAAKIHFAKAI